MRGGKREGAGRPTGSKPDSLTKFIGVKVSPELYQAVKDRAKLEKSSVMALVRKAIENYLTEQGEAKMIISQKAADLLKSVLNCTAGFEQREDVIRHIHKAQAGTTETIEALSVLKSLDDTLMNMQDENSDIYVCNTVFNDCHILETRTYEPTDREGYFYKIYSISVITPADIEEASKEQ